MSKQYRILLASTFFVGVLFSLGQGFTAPISLVSGISEPVIEQWVIGLLFFLITLLVAKIIKVELIHGYLERALKVKVPTLIGDIGSGVIVFTGACLILSLVFKQNISALLVTGAGSAAILGFALKDFAVALAAGITFNFEDTLRVGDRIRVMIDKDGYEGVVQKITWRNTVIQTDLLQTIFIPNVRLSNAAIINFDLPNKAVKRILKLEIDYDVSVDSVERVLYAGTLNAVGVKFTAPPVVRANMLKESGIEYLITYTISDMKDRLPSEHAIIKSVLESLRVANISLARGFDFDRKVKIANRSLDVYHLVQQVRLFSNVGEEITRDIVNMLEPKRYSPFETVIYAGERDQSLFIVAEGIVSMGGIGDDDQIQRKRFIATEFFGVESILLNLPNQSSIQSDTESLLYVLTKDSLQQLLGQYPSLVMILSKNLARISDLSMGAAIETPEGLAYRENLYRGIIEANYQNIESRVA